MWGKTLLLLAALALAVSALCPDGVVEGPAEQCDDNNSVNGDGCSEFCLVEHGPSACGFSPGNNVNRGAMLFDIDAVWPTDEFTVAFWMKSSTTTSKTILSYAAVDTDELTIRILGSSDLRVIVKGTMSPPCNGAVLQNGVWHHVAVYWRTGQAMRAVVDGSAFNCGATVLTGSMDQGGQLIMGAQQNTPFGGLTFDLSNYQYSGFLSDVRIWNRQLDPVDLIRMSAQGSCSTGSANSVGLLHGWRLDECGGLEFANQVHTSANGSYHNILNAPAPMWEAASGEMAFQLSDCCGDGVITPGEGCDDASFEKDDGCSACLSVTPGFDCDVVGQPCNSTCGDGRVSRLATSGPEVCDDGGNDGGDGCDANCQQEAGWSCVNLLDDATPTVCVDVPGNSIQTSNEACDDGNVVSGDGCSDDCFVAEAGFNCVTPGEACVPICGDGMIVLGENCDDSNTVPGDGCSEVCMLEFHPDHPCGYDLGRSQSLQGVMRFDLGPEMALTSYSWNWWFRRDSTLTTHEMLSYSADNQDEIRFYFLSSGTLSPMMQNVAAGSQGFNWMGDKEWHMITLTWQQGGSLIAYLDGAYFGAFTSASWNSPITPGGRLVFGSRQGQPWGGAYTSPTTRSDAQYSDIRLYDYRLAASDINLLYTQGSCLPDSADVGLVHHWRLDECGGTVFQDSASVNPVNGSFEEIGAGPVNSGWISPTGAILHSTAGCCGDGVLTVLEGCEDSHHGINDGCQACAQVTQGWDCLTPGSICNSTCGDGRVALGAEACDDGGTVPNDGCSADCLTVETGWACDPTFVEPTTCWEVCGDGIKTGIEACDDFTIISGDGCTGDCLAQEPGWDCSGGGACLAVCGDGQVVGPENCDDSNTSSGDGCSELCLEEDTRICGIRGMANTAISEASYSLEPVLPGHYTGLTFTWWWRAATTSPTQVTMFSYSSDEADGLWFYFSPTAVYAVLKNLSLGGKAVGVNLRADTTTWHHIALKRLDNGDLRFYVDGAFVTSFSASTVGAAPLTGGGRITLGARCTAPWCGAYSGSWLARDYFADFRVYLGVLDDVDLSRVANQGGCLIDTTTASLLHHFDTTKCGNGLPVDAVGGATVSVEQLSGTLEPARDRWIRPSGNLNLLSATCCGNGVKEGLEACDDGSLLSGDGCDTCNAIDVGYSCPPAGGDCTSVCGDGILTASEECEDGNQFNLDGCSTNCTVEDGWDCPGGTTCQEICGDGIKTRNEACDDGGFSRGCNDLCTVIEIGYECPTLGQPCSPLPGYNCMVEPCAYPCGDGLIAAPSESCDDSNAIDFDGCSSTCQLEEGWDCRADGINYICQPIGCGDNLIAVGSEECDDGNVDNGDGCDSHCVRECVWRPSGTCITKGEMFSASSVMSSIVVGAAVVVGLRGRKAPLTITVTDGESGLLSKTAVTASSRSLTTKASSGPSETLQAADLQSSVSGSQMGWIDGIAPEQKSMVSGMTAATGQTMASSSTNLSGGSDGTAAVSGVTLPRFARTPPKKWSQKDVREFLFANDLGRWAEMLDEVTGPAFVKLTDEDLEGIGIDNKMARISILSQIETAIDEGHGASGTPYSKD